MTIRLPDNLVRKARRKAAAEGTTLTALIEDGLRLVMNEDKPSGISRRVLPPISTAKGGLVAGIEVNQTAALEEMEDLTEASRLK